MLTVKIQYLNKQAQKPQQGTTQAAGWDLYCPESVLVHAQKTVKIPLGFAIELPPGWMGLILPRSSSPLDHDLLIHSPPIDSDYRGELAVIVTNMNPDQDAFPLLIKAHQRIAQLVFHPVPVVAWQKVDELSWTERGSAGFGSTGK